MKTKKLFSLLLALLLAFGTVTVAFAASAYSGTVDGDITIQKNDTIQQGTIFTGNVTIAKSAKVTTGIFLGKVTVLCPDGFEYLTAVDGEISGGEFRGEVINNGKISGGKFAKSVTNSGTISADSSIPEFSAAVTNNGTISGGKFTGAVSNPDGGKIYGGEFSKSIENNGTISGGTFNGSITNKSKISGGTFNSSVTNTGTISYGTFNGSVSNSGTVSGGSFNGVVTNTGSINGGSYNNVIKNSGTVKNTITAIIFTPAEKGGTYTVQGSLLTIDKDITLDGSNVSFVLPENKTLTVTADGKLTLNCPCTINGNLIVNGKLVSNTGSLTEGSKGKIRVPYTASFTGLAVSKFSAITFIQRKIEIKSNIDVNQFDLTVADYAYNGEKVTYSFDLAGSIKGCLTLNNITVYSGSVKDSNVIKKGADTIDSFTMPQNSVVIYVDCVANHTTVNEHKDATCTAAGYDRTKCTKCGHIISETEIKAKGHSYTAWVYDNTGSNALKTRTCNACGASEKAYIEIVGYQKNITAKYKSTITFKANVKPNSGFTIKWYDGNTELGSGETLTVTERTADYTVKAVVIGLNVGGIDYSEIETVTVKHGLFDRLIAFFQGIFNALPKYEQTASGLIKK